MPKPDPEPTIKTIAPLTRIEGHLDIKIKVEDGIVVDAASSGTMFRGFEIILQGRDPRDAPHYTQRICGVCPISHGMASTKTLEAAFGIAPLDNGRILRNLVLGANFLQSHILHFYHLAALDYVNTVGTAAEKSPWQPTYDVDLLSGGDAAGLIGNYLAALQMRRDAHVMGAIFGGKMPCAPTFVPGGCTETVTEEKIDAFRALLTGITYFIDNTYIPDVQAVAGAFPQYSGIGQGCGNLLAYGVFETGSGLLFPSGTYTGGEPGGFDPSVIAEDVTYSYYHDSTSGLNPAIGLTEPHLAKMGGGSDAYSWLKAPRYGGAVYEVGPLARMKVAGLYAEGGISVLDRLMARALESAAVATAMSGWLNELTPGEPAHTWQECPTSGFGMGLTEAPRGALGHWIDIADSKIARYQVVTPTNWNASPRDDSGQLGPIEQALIETPVGDIDQPIEPLRVVHSFDPCLACSVHVVRPRGHVRGFRPGG